MPSDVIIAGSGIAACACALRVASLGFRPFLLTRELEMAGGIEAIGESCWPLIQDIGLWNALEEAGAEFVKGFENAWDESDSEMKSGYWAHVERRAFAERALREAVRRGATLFHVSKLAPLHSSQDCVQVEIGGSVRRFSAAVDATGRAACWSRPLERQGRELATLFEAPRGCHKAGKVIRLASGWAFSIGLNSTATVGLVGEYPALIDVVTRARIGIEGEGSFKGRRPAFAQWCQSPILERRISVGDAALAYNPIAGHGIHFALAGATKAAAVIRAWQDGPEPSAIAERYYTSFVTSARLSHLKFLSSLQDPPAAPPAPVPLPIEVRFTATVRSTELNYGGEILQGDAIEIDGGAMVRWLGDFDLLALRALAAAAVPTCRLARELELPPARADRVIRWCVDRGILSAPPEPPV
jgi:hypothetical protein